MMYCYGIPGTTVLVITRHFARVLTVAGWHCTAKSPLPRDMCDVCVSLSRGLRPQRSSLVVTGTDTVVLNVDGWKY